MRTLLFKNNVHNTEKTDIPGDVPRAVNLTIRKGLKWAGLKVGETIEIRETGADTPPCGWEEKAVVFDIKVMIFKDCMNYDKMLDLEQNPNCRDYRGLYKVMKSVYDGFLQHELVTLVYYELV